MMFSVVVEAGAVHYGPEGQNVTCPHCHAQVVTTVKAEATTKTHLIALLLCCCV